MATLEPLTGATDARPAHSIDVEVLRRAGMWHALGDVQPLIRAAVAATAAAAGGVPATAELAVVLTDDHEVAALNARFRGRNQPTNVLSFPVRNSAAPGYGPAALGDVIIAYETVMAEATAQDKDPRHHLCHLVVHGVLHLLGWDHGDDATAEAMERLERRILAGLGISDPYCEPTAPSAANGHHPPDHHE